MKLFYNGNILTMDISGTTCSAMAVDNGNIIDIGNDDLLSKYPESNGVDLEGKTVVPGFFDSHLHLISTFLSEIAIDFSDSRSISDVLDKIKSWKNRHNLPIVIGKRISEFNLKERRLPTRKELDAVSKDFSLIISSIEFHTVILNSMALNSLKLPFTSQGFERDEYNNFTGRLCNRSAFIALKKVYEMLDEKTYLLGAENTFKKAVEKGVTTMVAVEGGSLFHDRHPRIILNNLNSFPIDVEILYSTTDVKKVIDCKLNRVGGDIFLDGSFRSQNAALYSPYSDAKDCMGELFFTLDELIDFIQQAHKLDLQVSVHAVGPRAIDRLLDAYEKVLTDMPKKNHRHRIEHFELPTSDQILRARDLGLVLGMHPTYEFFFRGENMMYHTRLGKERASQTNPFREIIDSGIIVAGCSDSDVMPIDPMLGIHAAVNHPNTKHRITPYEAIRMYTYNGAYSIFQEEIKGSLERGKVADFVILGENPLECSFESIKDIEVCSTYKNGQCIYEGKSYD